VGGGDPFAALGLPATASPEQVKAAYRAAARRLHPDAGGDDDSFRALIPAARRAQAYASGAEPNPYVATEDHTVLVAGYDRHAHSPLPPPRLLNRAFFWMLPVAGVVFMVAGATGRYFLPVFLGGMALLATVGWLVRRR